MKLPLLEINPVDLETQVTIGNINKIKHPTSNLYIYKYTKNAQYEQHWNPYTISSRGLILDGAYNIKSRPFMKFFNYHEILNTYAQTRFTFIDKDGVEKQIKTLPKDLVPNIPDEPYEVYEKLDGSLGISYLDDNGDMKLTLSGSFEWVADIINDILNRKYGKNPIAKVILEKYTFLFEVITPTHKIVVDYGDTEDLFLLGVIETATGIELDIYDLPFDVPFPKVQKHDKTIEEILAEDSDSREGYVVLFRKSGLRVKFKFPTYVEKHKNITILTDTQIWEYLYEGKSYEEILELVPDELQNVVMGQIARFESEYKKIMDELESIYVRVPSFDNRKDLSLYLNVNIDKFYIHLYWAKYDDEFEVLRKNIFKKIKPKQKTIMRKSV